jgi:hypothetical protein
MVQYLDVFYISLNINLNYYFSQIIKKKKKKKTSISAQFIQGMNSLEPYAQIQKVNEEIKSL